MVISFRQSLAPLCFLLGFIAISSSHGQLANGTHLSSEVPGAIPLGEGLDVFTAVKNTGPVIAWTRWQLGLVKPSWAAAWAGSGRFYTINSYVLTGDTNYAFRTLAPADLPSQPGDYSFEVRAYYEASKNVFNFMSNTFKVVNFTLLPAPPRFTDIKATAGEITMTITNLVPGSTNDILYSGSPASLIWNTGRTFIATSYNTNWSQSPVQGGMFYRVRSRR